MATNAKEGIESQVGGVGIDDTRRVRSGESLLQKVFVGFCNAVSKSFGLVSTRGDAVKIHV